MNAPSKKLLLDAKRYGFSDRQLAHLWKTDELTVRRWRKSQGIEPVFKTIDTCAAEFQAETPYHYSTYETETEVIRTPQHFDHTANTVLAVGRKFEHLHVDDHAVEIVSTIHLVRLDANAIFRPGRRRQLHSIRNVDPLL